MQLLGFALLTTLLLLPGLLVWRCVRSRLVIAFSWLESTFFVLVSSIFLVAWSGLLLAAFGRFSLPGLLLLTTAVTLIVALACTRLLPASAHKTPATTKHRFLDLAALILLILIGLSSLPAHNYFIGGRDHGIYINTGIHISRSGAIFTYDTLLPEVPAADRSVLVNPKTDPYQSGLPGPWSEGQRLAGLTIRDLEQGVAVPHGFHFYPAIIAIFAATVGDQLAIYATLFVGLLALLASYLTIRRVVNAPVALLVLLVLGVNVAVRWYLRTPSAESVVMLYFWAAMWALTLATLSQRAQQSDRFSAESETFFLVLAGLFFAATHLAKLDTVFIPVALASYGFYLWLTGRFKRPQLIGLCVYLLLSLHAVLHAWFIATIYFIDHLVRVILPDFLAEPLVVAASGVTDPSRILGRLIAQNWLAIGLIVLAALLGLMLLNWVRPWVAKGLLSAEKQQNYVQIALALPLALYVGWQLLQLFSGQLSVYDSWFVARLYVTRIGVLFAIVGLLWAVVVVRNTSARLLVWMVLVNAGYLFVLGHQTAGDHFWIARRFVPIAIPGFVLAAVWVVGHVTRRWQQPLRVGVLSALVALLLWGMLPHSLNQLDFVEMRDVWGQVAQFSAEMEPDDVLLFPASGPAYRLTLPLWLLFDRNVYQIEQVNWEDARLPTTVALWQAQGRAVYWADLATVALPDWVKNSAEIVATSNLQFELMEQPSDRIPAQAIPSDVTINLRRFE